MSACPTPHKIAHADKAAAVAHWRHLRKAGGSVDLHPYRCQCNAWHVGHSIVSLRRRIRRALTGRLTR